MFVKVIKELFKRQEIRFLLVGGLNTIVGYGSYSILLLFQMNYLVANTFSTIIGIIHSYIWNRNFTFKSKEKALHEIIKFVLVYALSYILGMILLYFVVQKFGCNEYLAGFFNLIFTTLISWFGHKYFSFAKKVKE